MNVITRKQFNAFISDMKFCDIKVVDTETNGLYPYRGNHMVSMSVYFPEVGRVYNLAFRQGEGSVEISYTDKYPEGTNFNELPWTGKAKQQWYLGYWFNEFKHDQPKDYFGNLPIAWLEEIKAVWGKGTYILHNSKFDAHVLYCEGFPDMEKVYDTMIALHIVFEDWRHIQLEAPYTWTVKDAPSPDLVGMWAVDDNGNLLKKMQYANRQLKWQSAYHGFKNATAGETALFRARRKFEAILVDYVLANIENTMNASLRSSNQEKQREKIASKLHIDDKAHLWMLPSEDVAYYAELDVILTWQLYEWCMGVLKKWNNVQLFEDQSTIHHKVAWVMERNGFKLDIDAAEAQIAMLEPRIAEIKDILQRIAMDFGMDDFNAESPTQLLEFLNSGVLGVDYKCFPEWFDPKKTVGLKTYPNIRVRTADTYDSGDELYGTDKRELEKVEDHAVVRLIKELRMMRKSVTTYLRKWINAANDEGMVHATINDDGTVSGRAASSGDAGNMQNVPDRGGYTIKKAIVPPSSNWRLVAIDYGQLELRLGAWIAETLLGLDNNKVMTNLFLSGNDMHSYVRDNINVRNILFGGMTDDEIIVKLGYSPTHEKTDTPKKRADVVAKHCRQVAKTMNFGLLYSGGKGMLSKLLKIDTDVADILVKNWRRMFPAFTRTQEFITEECQRRRDFPDGSTGNVAYYTQPISGRHRKLHLYPTTFWYYEDGEKLYFNPREAAARKVWNSTVQGLGGYICMMSAARINEFMGEDVRMFAQIHDALEMFVHKDALHKVPEMGRLMCDWPDITPALTVDIQGSIDGTWQGMTSISDMDKWIASGGTEGMEE